MPTPFISEVVYFELDQSCQEKVQGYDYRCSNLDCEEHHKILSVKPGSRCSVCESKFLRRPNDNVRWKFPDLDQVCKELGLDREKLYESERYGFIWICEDHNLSFELPGWDDIKDLSSFNPDKLWESFKRWDDPELYEMNLKLTQKFGDKIKLKFGIELNPDC